MSIFWRHLGSLEACVKYVGSSGEGAKLAMRQVGMRYRMASQIFGVLVLSCVLMTIWWVLVGGGLGAAEDEDEEEEDSSVGTGRGGGEEVCERGGGGGGESMAGPTEEEGTGTVKDNKDVDMGIGGEGLGAGGVRDDRGDLKGKDN